MAQRCGGPSHSPVAATTPTVASLMGLQSYVDELRATLAAELAEQARVFEQRKMAELAEQASVFEQRKAAFQLNIKVLREKNRVLEDRLKEYDAKYTMLLQQATHAHEALLALCGTHPAVLAATSAAAAAGSAAVPAGPAPSLPCQVDLAAASPFKSDAGAAGAADVAGAASAVAAAAEVKRVADEAAARRVAEAGSEERRRAEAADAARRLAVAESARRLAEEEQDEARRVAEAAEARQQAEAAEARRQAEAAEAQRQAEAAEARRQAQLAQECEGAMDVVVASVLEAEARRLAHEVQRSVWADLAHAAADAALGALLGMEVEQLAAQVLPNCLPIASLISWQLPL